MPQLNTGLICIGLMLMLVCCGNRQPQNDPITIAVPYELDSLDPHARNSLSNFALLSHFYEPLVITDANMRTLPCLARRWENPDLSTWIFYLEPDAKFHNGKQLVADDVVYTFERLMKSQTLEIAGYLPGISEVTAIDAHTLKLQTVGPINILLNKLRFVLILPRSEHPEKPIEEINGTGPFRFANWKKREDLRIVRNEDYWGKRVAPSEVNFILKQTPEAALHLLVTGKAQLIQCNSKKLESSIREDERFEMLRRDSMFLKYVGFDVAREITPHCARQPNPLRERMVRNAFHVGINRDELTRKLTTYAVPATQPIPPFIFGYNPEIEAPQYNPEYAKRLLAEAGLPEGFTITLHVRSIFHEAATLVASQLERIGVQLKVESLPDSIILPGLRKHEYSLFLSRMGSPTGDASDILDNCFHTANASRHLGVMNYGMYSNVEVDRAIEESAEISLINRRRNAVQNIMTLVMLDLPWIPLYIDQDVYAIDKAYTWTPRNDSFILASEIQIRK